MANNRTDSILLANWVVTPPSARKQSADSVHTGKATLPDTFSPCHSYNPATTGRWEYSTVYLSETARRGHTTLYNPSDAPSLAQLLPFV